MKILIIRLSAIGDTIHCLPAAAELKSALPGLSLSWLVEPASAPLLTGNPAVDRVFVLPKKDWLQGLKSPLSWPATLTGVGAFFSELKAEKFNLAVDFQGLLKSSVAGLLSGATMRVGLAHTREGADRFLTRRLDVGDYFAHDRHVVEHNLALARFAITCAGGEPTQLPARFPLPAPSPDTVARMASLVGRGPGGQSGGEFGASPVVVLIPGTTWTSKIWPLDKWRKLSELLSAEISPRFCLVGGAAEAETNSDIAAHIRSVDSRAVVADLTDKTSLIDLICLFSQSDLVIGADTGPLHLAAAVGRPSVIGIYGSTPWRRNGPFGEHCRSVSLSLWCQPCFAKTCPLGTTACLTDLAVESVMDAVREKLSERERQ